jgi:hypothetical protein
VEVDLLDLRTEFRHKNLRVAKLIDIAVWDCYEGVLDSNR